MTMMFEIYILPVNV